LGGENPQLKISSPPPLSQQTPGENPAPNRPPVRGGFATTNPGPTTPQKTKKPVERAKNGFYKAPPPPLTVPIAKIENFGGGPPPPPPPPGPPPPKNTPDPTPPPESPHPLSAGPPRFFYAAVFRPRPPPVRFSALTVPAEKAKKKKQKNTKASENAPVGPRHQRGSPPPPPNGLFLWLAGSVSPPPHPPPPVEQGPPGPLMAWGRFFLGPPFLAPRFSPNPLLHKHDEGGKLSGHRGPPGKKKKNNKPPSSKKVFRWRWGWADAPREEDLAPP